MAANGEKANRTLALILADNGRNLTRALDLARAEFDVRNDLYSWDALGWVLYKSKQFAEAAKASEKALAQNTPEPAFYFHAGMIAEANGDNGESDNVAGESAHSESGVRPAQRGNSEGCAGTAGTMISSPPDD